MIGNKLYFPLISVNPKSQIIFNSMDLPEKLSRTKVKELIAERIKTPNESLRQCKNKINGRLKTAIANGKIEVDAKGNLFTNSLSSYVKAKWPGCFDDWPSPLIIGGVIGRGFESKLDAHLYYLPENVAACHDEIRRLYGELTSLEKTNKAQALELKALKPDAMRYRQIKEKNRLNGLKSKKRKDY